METIINILIAVLAVSLVSILGLFIFYKQKSFNRLLFLLVSFAAGTMIGVAFLDLLPEVIENGFSESIPL